MYKHMESTTIEASRARAAAHSRKNIEKNFSEVFYRTISLVTIKKKIWSWPKACSCARTGDSDCSVATMPSATPSTYPRGTPHDSSPDSPGTSASCLQKGEIEKDIV